MTHEDEEEMFERADYEHDTKVTQELEDRASDLKDWEQWAYNTAKQGIIEQGAFAYHKTNGCQYRLDGLKCAAGHLMPDSEYNAEYDEGLVADELPLSALQISDSDPCAERKVEFVTHLQEAHDETACSDGNATYIAWAARMTKAADKHGLEP